MTNFEKLLEKDKEEVIKQIAENCCVDTVNHKIIPMILCDTCQFDSKDCVNSLLKWLKSEAGV